MNDITLLRDVPNIDADGRVDLIKCEHEHVDYATKRDCALNANELTFPIFFELGLRLRALNCVFAPPAHVCIPTS